MLKPANHGRTCQLCDGSGWIEGPPILSQAAGQPITYTTVVPCTHPWWNDEPELPLDTDARD